MEKKLFNKYKRFEVLLKLKFYAINSKTRLYEIAVNYNSRNYKLLKK